MEKLETFELETKKRFQQHPLFKYGATGPLTSEQLKIVFSQYLQPLHYFPDFLSHLIALLPSIDQKTYISRILYQELGEGDPSNAHEVAYFKCLEDLNLAKTKILEHELYIETSDLMNMYKSASTDLEKSLGVLFATEVADLAIITGLYQLIKRNFGKELPLWVRLHIQQEPDHVKSSMETLCVRSPHTSQQKVLEFAEECSQKWYNFFDSILKNVSEEDSKNVVGVAL